MFKILIRLYLVTIVSFAMASYLVPGVIVSLFHERFMNYNVDMSRGMQTLLVKQFHHLPPEQWPSLAQELDTQFQPMRVNLLPITDAKFTAEEQRQLQQGQGVLRIGK